MLGFVWQPFNGLQKGASVELKQKNRLTGIWTVRLENGSEVSAPSIVFAGSTAELAVSSVTWPSVSFPTPANVGCTAIIQTYDRMRRGAARALVQRLAAFGPLIVSVVLLSNHLEDKFDLPLHATHAPIVLVQNVGVVGAASVANRWLLPEALASTHCAIVFDDDIVVNADAVRCLLRSAIDAHAANSSASHFGLGLGMALSENAYSFASRGKYNMPTMGKTSFARFQCLRQLYANGPAAAHAIVADQAGHCDDILATLLLAQHGQHGVCLGHDDMFSQTMASFSGLYRRGSQGAPIGSVQRRQLRTECLAMLREALDNTPLPPLISDVAPCAPQSRADLKVHVAVLVPELFNRSRNNFGGLAHVASIYLATRFADPAIADFGDIGRVQLTFVVCGADPLLLLPEQDHTHPVMSDVHYIASVQHGLRPRPALLWAIDLKQSYLGVAVAFPAVPVLLWAQAPIAARVREYMSLVRFPMMPLFELRSATPPISNPDAILAQLEPERRSVFVALVDVYGEQRLSDAYCSGSADERARNYSATIVGSLCNPLDAPECGPMRKGGEKAQRCGDVAECAHDCTSHCSALSTSSSDRGWRSKWRVGCKRSISRLAVLSLRLWARFPPK